MSWSFTINAANLLQGVNISGITPHLLQGVYDSAASVVLRHILSLWPIDTGKSIASFRTGPDGLEWRVFSDVDYVQYVNGDLADVLALEGIRLARPAAIAQVAVLQSGVGAPRSARQSIRSRLAANRARRPASAHLVPSTPATTQAVSAKSVRDAQSIIRPLVAQGTVPSNVASLVRAGRLGGGATALRSAGQQAAARRIETIQRRPVGI